MRRVIKLQTQTRHYCREIAFRYLHGSYGILNFKQQSVAVSCCAWHQEFKKVLCMPAFRFSSQDIRKKQNCIARVRNRRVQEILSIVHGHENCQKCWTHFFLYISATSALDLFIVLPPVKLKLITHFLGEKNLFAWGVKVPSIGVCPTHKSNDFQHGCIGTPEPWDVALPAISQHEV